MCTETKALATMVCKQQRRVHNNVKHKIFYNSFCFKSFWKLRDIICAFCTAKRKYINIQSKSFHFPFNSIIFVVRKCGYIHGPILHERRCSYKNCKYLWFAQRILAYLTIILFYLDILRIYGLIIIIIWWDIVIIYFIIVYCNQM